MMFRKSLAEPLGLAAPVSSSASDWRLITTCAVPEYCLVACSEITTAIATGITNAISIGSQRRRMIVR